MPAASASIGVSLAQARPSISSSPSSAGCAPEMILISVLLPQPFSPTRWWLRPGSMRRLPPRSACTPAKRLCTPRTSRKGTAASGGAGTGVIAGSERVLLVVGLVHVHPGLAGDDHALARAFLDADLVVAARAQVHAVGDRLAVEQQLGHLV